METKNLICHKGCEYFWENNHLYENATKRRVCEQNYLFASNYGTKPYNILAIENDVYFIYPDRVEKVFTCQLLQEDRAEYFYTENTGDEDGNETYVFVRRENSKKPALLGRSLRLITEDVYKIGKQAYQVINGQLHDMCPCTEFEIFRNMLEIQTGDDFSKVIIYKKTSKGWKKEREYDQNTLRFCKHDIYF